jgi:ATP-dependent DNA helicase RecG
VIVQILADLGFVERPGYGLDRVLAVLQAHHLRPPRFEETAGCFRVTLFSSGSSGEGLANGSAKNLAPPDLTVYQGLGLNPRQEAALGYIAEHRRITNSAYQELCQNVHPETLRRDLVDLVTRGILIKVGDKKATYYILK